MTTREKAPTILTAEGARRLVSKARNALAVADDVLAQLYAGEAWVALGHADWSALCDAELPELRHLKLRKPERQARVRALLEQGASVREIAAATGAAVGTVHGDVAAVQAPECSEMNTTPESRADQIVRLLAARGARGATSPEMARLAKCSQGAASGGLSRLHGQGRVRPTREQRGGFGIYVVAGRSA